MAKHFMQNAVKHPGALTKKANAAGESVSEFAHSHDTGNSTTARQSRLAEVFENVSHHNHSGASQSSAHHSAVAQMIKQHGK